METMNQRILIVEDEFIVANDLRLKLGRRGYDICGIASSVETAREMVETLRPAWVLLDIYLQDEMLGIDLATLLTEKNIGFIYISANMNTSVLESAQATRPNGFLSKPFRERDLLALLNSAIRNKNWN
ncbi:hypothetical protein GCM10023149_16080 [Mucilaginibacter gynuensis]|uniref:Response regulatory domain-containing protein n=1 Tax=Mucilaginibacter gynuensis TaxID=1302236 RepID=A0ABP8G663_9SPHI